MTPFSFKISFQELPLFWRYADAIAWRGGMVDGEAEVSVHGPNDWVIADVSIACDNGQFGSQAKGKLINLSADDDERLYLLLLDSLDHKYSSYIEERIVEEAIERGLPLAA